MVFDTNLFGRVPSSRNALARIVSLNRCAVSEETFIRCTSLNPLAIMFQNADGMRTAHVRRHDFRFEADEFRIGGLHEDIQEAALERGLRLEARL